MGVSAFRQRITSADTDARRPTSKESQLRGARGNEFHPNHDHFERFDLTF